MARISCEFQLPLRGNYLPFRDIARHWPKTANFPTSRVFNAPPSLMVLPFEFCNGVRSAYE